MAGIYGMGTLLSKESGSGHLRLSLGLGALQLSSALPQPFGFLPRHLCLCRKAATAPCVLIVSRPATEGRKRAFLQWLSPLIQKLICPRNFQDLLPLSLAQMPAWLLMTQEASELVFDRGSPSQTRVHKKRVTGMSLSCWTDILACRCTEAPGVTGEDWTEAQQLLMSRGPGPVIVIMIDILSSEGGCSSPRLGRKAVDSP